MAELSNAEILREAYEKRNACEASDLTMRDDYVTGDIELRTMAGGSCGLHFSAARSGKEQLHAYLREPTRAFEMEHWTMTDMIAEGERVVGLGATAWVSRDTTKRFETPVAIVCRFRGRHVCECQEFNDPAALAAALLE